MSPISSCPSQPIFAQTSGGSGTVAIWAEFSGTHSRLRPGRVAVKPSVQRRMIGAAEFGAGERRGDDQRILVFGKEVAVEARSQASASPRTSLAG